MEGFCLRLLCSYRRGDDSDQSRWTPLHYLNWRRTYVSDRSLTLLRSETRPTNNADIKNVWGGITVYPRLFGVNISSGLPTSHHKQD